MDLWFIYVKKLYSTKLSLLTEKGNFAVSCRNGVFHQNNLLPNQSGFANLLLKKNPRMIKEKSKNQVSGIQSLLGIFPSLWQACHTCRCISNGTQCVKAI